MERQTLIAALAKAGIRPTRDADFEAIARTAEVLRDSADQIRRWLAEVDHDQPR
ncbi:hypothetical protein AB0T83_18170 [Fluviibacterium sp. DFM31]|uniref:Uncharacterized protein n=1 Tax=Meridianimarinicoccus marinus TaxID=3231483 RepID=A0ABV3LAW5_9RHOB